MELTKLTDGPGEALVPRAKAQADRRRSRPDAGDNTVRRWPARDGHRRRLALYEYGWVVDPIEIPPGSRPRRPPIGTSNSANPGALPGVMDFLSAPFCTRALLRSTNSTNLMELKKVIMRQFFFCAPDSYRSVNSSWICMPSSFPVFQIAGDERRRMMAPAPVVFVFFFKTSVVFV